MKIGKGFVKSVATIAMVLLRDKRHGRLLLRFATCTRHLEVRRGTLGVIIETKALQTAEDLVKGNAAGVHTVLRSQVGEATNNDRVGGAGGGL